MASPIKKKYRSNFERDFARRFPALKYETVTVPYSMEHKYIVDFVDTKAKRYCWYELKGRFRTRAEASKYVAINNKYPRKLVMVFMDPLKPMPGARARKDGTKQTMKEWAEANDIKWTTASAMESEMKEIKCN